VPLPELRSLLPRLSVLERLPLTVFGILRLTTTPEVVFFGEDDALPAADDALPAAEDAILPEMFRERQDYHD